MVAQPKAPDLNQVAEESISNSSSRRRAPLIRRTDQQWLSLFIQHNNSDLNLADFCKPRGMSPSSFSTKRKLLLSKYSIDDLNSLDLNNIDFSAPREVDCDSTNRLPEADDEVVESSSDQAQHFKSNDKSDHVVKIILNDITIMLPMSHGPQWALEFLNGLVKLNSEMQR